MSIRKVSDLPVQQNLAGLATLGQTRFEISRAISAEGVRFVSEQVKYSDLSAVICNSVSSSIVVPATPSRMGMIKIGYDERGEGDFALSVDADGQAFTIVHNLDFSRIANVPYESEKWTFTIMQDGQTRTVDKYITIRKQT